MGEGGAHDGLFKVAMQDPEVAEALVRENLPAEVLAAVEPGPPELMPEGYVDAALRAGQSDALLRLRLKEGGDLFVLCLVEHKSQPDGWVALQLLRYQVAIWEKERSAGAATLSPVLPLVLYHGERKWTVPRRFSALLHGGPALARLGVDFEYGLLDAERGDGEALARHARLRAVLEGLKYGARPGTSKDVLVEVVFRVVSELREASVYLLRAYFSYVGDRYTPLDREAVEEVVRKAAGGREQAMISLWKQEVLEEGRMEGRAEGAVAMLRQLLIRRFGPLPANVEARLARAGFEELQGWMAAALEAPTVEAVFTSSRG